MTQIDTFPGLSPGPTGPATRLFTVTPSDSAPLPMVARTLWIGTAGDVRVLSRDNMVAVTIPNVPSGPLEVWTRQVFATGTTASGIVGFA